MATDKSGSPLCGIYLRIDDYSDMPEIITTIRQMALVINRTSGYEKNMCVVEFVKSSNEEKEPITDLIELTKAQGFVAVISGAFKDHLGADGVLLTRSEDIMTHRASLGEEAIIGLKCGKDKDLAQKAILLEADYVELTADLKLISWFKGMGTSILCCAHGKKTTPDKASNLAHSGADLVNASGYILKHKKGAMQAVVNIQHAIEVAS